jgi:hypothetical protein
VDPRVIEFHCIMPIANLRLKSKRNGDTSEQDLEAFIMDWKKSWRTDEKKEAVASAIRNLIMLGWLQLKISEDAPEIA